jgi:lysophospholipase L1-like esterase
VKAVHRILACAVLFVACTPPLPDRARFFGRVDWSDPAGPRFAWSATGFAARFSGPRVSFEIADLPKHPSPEGLTWPNRFQIAIDDRAPVQAIVPASGRLVWSAEDLGAGDHRVTVVKQTEAMVGEAQLLSLRADRFLPPPPAPARRIEFIGDSFTTGYGDEGTDKHCPFSEATQNQFLAFGSLAARALDAEHHVIAWSGKGVVRNYDSPKKPIPPEPTDPIERAVVPELYDRTLPGRADSQWRYAAWQPDAVVIMLGFNDISAIDPGEERFVAAYERLLERVRAHYPLADIVCIVPDVDDAWPPELHARTKMRRYVGRAVRARADPRVHLTELPPGDPSDGLGCDYHPSLVRHAAVSRHVTEILRHVLSW